VLPLGWLQANRSLTQGSLASPRVCVVRATGYGSGWVCPLRVGSSLWDAVDAARGLSLSPPSAGADLIIQSDRIIRGAVGAQNGPAWRTVNSAANYLLNKLIPYPRRLIPPDYSRTETSIIRARHAAGISQAELARQFGISYQRVHQIVNYKRK